MTFESQPQAIVHTVVVHPPGTTYDADGNPIPPLDAQTPGDGTNTEDE